MPIEEEANTGLEVKGVEGEGKLSIWVAMDTINQHGMAVGGGSHRATKLRIRAGIVGGKLAMHGKTR